MSPNTKNEIEDNALPHAIFQHIDREIHFHFERTLDELIKFQAKQGKKNMGSYFTRGVD